VSVSGSQGASDAGASLLSSIPAMPRLKPTAVYRGSPRLLLESGNRYSLGWQDHRSAGPSFVVARLSQLGPPKVTERFPLTEEGWASGWRALTEVDAEAATAIAAQLADQEAGRLATAALAALEDEALYRLLNVTFRGGSGGVSLVKGHIYDVRFLADRLQICRPRVAVAVVEVPYPDVEAVEVGGPGLITWSAAEVLALTLGLALVGAVLGYVIHHLLGLSLGAMILGLIGAMVAASATRTETIVRIRRSDAEYNFMHAGMDPDALRTDLSEPFMAIHNARAVRPAGSGPAAARVSESVADQLTKLAALMQDDLITRDEFERLKAKLIPEA
jgi:hypothetical protein